MRPHPARDDDDVLLSVTQAAWLARTSEQNLRNWLRGTQLLAKTGTQAARISYRDLRQALAERGKQQPLQPGWLTITPDDPLPSRGHVAETPGGDDASTATQTDSATTWGVAEGKAREAATATELEAAWQRERQLAVERDRWRLAAKGYRKALRALERKDKRMEGLLGPP